VDLLALALLMATLRDWLPICQRRVPLVCRDQSSFPLEVWNQTYTQSRGQHACRDHQVGEHVGRHAEGQKDRLAGI
jgi:hypothetical protein